MADLGRMMRYRMIAALKLGTTIVLFSIILFHSAASR